MARDIALYSAHIPLDLHPEVGNNVELARVIGLPVEGWFGAYRGVTIGVWGLAPSALAERVYLARFSDEKAVYNILAEPLRVVSEG